MGFFEKLLKFFFRSSQVSAEMEKKFLLEGILKDISHNKFRKFYKPLSGELDPMVGNFFYQIHKAVYQAGLFMKNASQSMQLKESIIEHLMESELTDLKERLSLSSIEGRIKVMDSKELVDEVKQDLEAFNAAFNLKLIHKIDQYYNLVMVFTQFVTFDFFALAKPFDPELLEKNFDYTPKFRRAKADFLIEYIERFLEIIHFIDQDYDWPTILLLASQYRNVDVIKPNIWRSLLSHIRQVESTNILMLIVRHVSKNPTWQPHIQFPDYHIADTYRIFKKDQAQECLNKIIKTKQNDHVTALLTAIFGSTTVAPRLLYYSEMEQQALLDKQLEGFIWAQPLNFLRSFLIDYYKVTARELCDVFLIQGHWSSPELSRRFSDSFQEGMRVFDSISAFDEAVAPDGSSGMRLRAFITMNKIKQAQIILSGINVEAKNLIMTTIKGMDMVANQFHSLYVDLTTKKFEILVNWKEIESEMPIEQRLNALYLRFMDFILMLRLSLGEEE
jgi:hypothetical protein